MRLIKPEDEELRGQNAEQDDQRNGQYNPQLQQCIKVTYSIRLYIILSCKFCDNVIIWFTALIGYY